MRMFFLLIVSNLKNFRTKRPILYNLMANQSFFSKLSACGSSYLIDAYIPETSGVAIIFFLLLFTSLKLF
jgi:hypothetical protein